MNNRKKIIIAVGLFIMTIAIIIFGFISINMSSLSLFSNNSQATGSSTDDSNASLEDILDKNNEELLRLIDTRKPVIFVLYGTDERSGICEKVEKYRRVISARKKFSENMVMGSIKRIESIFL